MKRITNDPRPVANRSGMNGPDGPCDKFVNCECIGVLRDEAGQPIGLLFEDPAGGDPIPCLIKAGPTQIIDPAKPPDSVTFADPENPTADELTAAAATLAAGQPWGTLIVYGDAPNQWIWYVDGVGNAQPIKCPVGPTQIIDPADPPDGVTFVDPENPTADELATAATVLLDSQPAGTKAKFGDAPCQWIYEVGLDGEVCLIERPVTVESARMRVSNLGAVLGNLTAASAIGVPLGYDAFNGLSFEVICKQDITVTGYIHLRYYGPVEGVVAQGTSVMILDGTPFVGNGEIWVVTGEVNATEFIVPFQQTFECVEPGTHTLAFDLYLFGFASELGQIHPNQMSFVITNLLR